LWFRVLIQHSHYTREVINGRQRIVEAAGYPFPSRYACFDTSIGYGIFILLSTKSVEAFLICSDVSSGRRMTTLQSKVD
jgi:hypothetical protein